MTAVEVKMADVSGTELSEEKETEIELKKRQKRPWDDLHKSGKLGITAELPETLGFYDISAVRREQRETSAGKRTGRVPPTYVTNVIRLIHVRRLLHVQFSSLAVSVSSVTVETL